MLGQLDEVGTKRPGLPWRQCRRGAPGGVAQRLSGAQGQGDGGGQGDGLAAPEDRPAYGRRVNEVKRGLEAAYEARGEALKEAARARSLAADQVDVSLPGRPPRPGRLHPATRTLREIYRIFAEMGFQVYRSRDVETDDYNFDLLNMPPHHPARDMWDTFYTTHARRHPADAHLAGPDPRHARVLSRADPRHPAGHVLPLRADHGPLGDHVQPGGGTGRGHGDHHGRSEGHHRRLCPAHVWRGPPGALPGQPLSLHRAERRGGHGLHPVRREGLPGVQVHRLAGDHGLWHGPPRGAGEWRLRSRTSTRALPLAWGRSASPCSSMASRTFAISGGTICDSWSSSARSASGAVSPLYRRA